MTAGTADDAQRRRDACGDDAHARPDRACCARGARHTAHNANGASFTRDTPSIRETLDIEIP